jgi:hypothetical protein
MSVAHILVIAIQRIKANRVALIDRTVTVTIFNDGDKGSNKLNGRKTMERFWKLVRPAVHLIDYQTNALGSLGLSTQLFFQWMPGHYQNIAPHQRAAYVEDG